MDSASYADRNGPIGALENCPISDAHFAARIERADSVDWYICVVQNFATCIYT